MHVSITHLDARPSAQADSDVLLRLTNVCLILAGLLNLIVYAIRIHSLLYQGYLTETTGYEAPMIYGIWKAAHHFPVYESLALPLSSNTLYNFNFYDTYGFLTSWISPADPLALLISRLITCLFAALGAALSSWAACCLTDFKRPGRIWQAILAASLFWFSSSPVGWFGISARPDLAATAMAALGLLLFLLYLKKHAESLIVCSSLAFFLAWSFKQNAILTFAGVVCIHLVLLRRWRPLLLQVSPFAVCALATLCLGGADYRFNTLVVPTLGVFMPSMAWTFPFKAVTENPLLYVTVPLAFLCLATRSSFC